MNVKDKVIGVVVEDPPEIEEAMRAAGHVLNRLSPSAVHGVFVEWLCVRATAIGLLCVAVCHLTPQC